VDIQLSGRIDYSIIERIRRPYFVSLGISAFFLPRKKAIDNPEFRPAVIVIGDSLHEKQQALNSGANAFIIKGDSPDLLTKIFRRLRKEKGFLGK
jgi:hypothetical protein